jgi:hypothetical protein
MNQKRKVTGGDIERGWSPCKIVKPYYNPFWEKSNRWRGKRKNRH